MFEPRIVQRMELLVLRILDWRLGSVTPLSYLSYFALKVDPTGTYTGFLTSRAKQIILSTIQGIFIFHLFFFYYYYYYYYYYNKHIMQIIVYSITIIFISLKIHTMLWIGIVYLYILVKITFFIFIGSRDKFHARTRAMHPRDTKKSGINTSSTVNQSVCDKTHILREYYMWNNKPL